MLIYYPKTTISTTSNSKVVTPLRYHKNPLEKHYDRAFSMPEDTTKDKIKQFERKAKHKINLKSSVPYKVKINRAENFVMIYGMDVYGKYKIPYKCFICSAAKNISSTLLGKYRLNDRYRWHMMVDGSYAQYAIRFYDKLMLHSVPYYKQSPDTLETEEYNKLGHFASLGCIRMRVSDIKWIYDHCRMGTEIVIYDKKGEKPLAPYENPKKLDTSDSKSNWDPTDPSKKNPWNK